jgi:hypothetical protein
MTHVLTRVAPIVLAVALFAAPVAAVADDQAPNRIGNIWQWHDHEPDPTQVVQQEKAAGVAPAPSKESSDAATLDQIYRQPLN